MTKKEQISNFLQEWDGDGYTVQDVYIEKECADLMAEGIVKLLGIAAVSKCQHPYKKVISGDDGMYCTECNKYITTF